ncbi:MAG: nicotinamide-nucleotide amidohydrolase family protein [Spirochaetales bacterium]
MKALILTINDNILSGLQENTCGNFLSDKLFNKGIDFSGNYVIDSSKTSILNALNSVSDETNTIIILGENNLSLNKEIKENICEYLKDELVVNEYAESAINLYYKNSNIPSEKASNSEALLPRESKLIENTLSVYQGFVTFKNGKHLIFLPSDLNALQNLYETWFVDYIEAQFPKLNLSTTLKTFGLKKSEALVILADLLKNKNLIKILIYPNELELTILIKYSVLTPKEDINAFLQNVIERLKNFIYATSNLNIYEVAFNLLKINGIKLAVAESITGGNIVSNLIKNNVGISEYVVEGITCYSNESKINRLNVDHNTLSTYSAVSVETAYEMAAGLLETTKNANFVLATTGYASGEGENTGLVFVALGNYDGIHVYKNKFTGTRESIIEMATKTALFYLIKKLK